MREWMKCVKRWGSALSDDPTQNVKWWASWVKLCCLELGLLGEKSFLATTELVVHSISSKSPWCVHLRAVCLTESWVCGCLHRGSFSPGWWIMNEFVFELVSWSWHNAGRCLCLNPLHPSLSDLPDSPSLSFLSSLYIEGSWEWICRRTLPGQ